MAHDVDAEGGAGGEECEKKRKMSTRSKNVCFTHVLTACSYIVAIHFSGWKLHGAAAAAAMINSGFAKCKISTNQQHWQIRVYCTAHRKRKQKRNEPEQNKCFQFVCIDVELDSVVSLYSRFWSHAFCIARNGTNAHRFLQFQNVKLCERLSQKSYIVWVYTVCTVHSPKIYIKHISVGFFCLCRLHVVCIPEKHIHIIFLPFLRAICAYIECARNMYSHVCGRTCVIVFFLSLSLVSNYSTVLYHSDFGSHSQWSMQMCIKTLTPSFTRFCCYCCCSLIFFVARARLRKRAHSNANKMKIFVLWAWFSECVYCTFERLEIVQINVKGIQQFLHSICATKRANER